MHPQRVAQLLAYSGGVILLILLALRVFSLIGAGVQRRLDAAVLSAPPLVPAVGRYQVSPDGMEITFQQQTGLNGQASWFTLSLAGGPIRPATGPSSDLRPFVLRSGALFVQTNNGAAILVSLPPNTVVSRYSLSPDRKMLAYAAARPDGSAGLYVLDDNGRLEWFGDFDGMDDIAWSPDGKALAFIALTNGVYQVMTIDHQGQNLRQITTSDLSKRLPVWSPDGKTIAYLVHENPGLWPVSLGTPTPDPLFPAESNPFNMPVLYYLELIQPGGVPWRPFKDGMLPLYNIAWVNHGAEIAYAERQEDESQNSLFFAANPTTGMARKIYPPYTIAALTCPARLAQGSSGAVTLSVKNTGQAQASIPVMARSGPRPFSLTGPWTAGDPRTDTVQASLGATVPATFTVRPARGLKTYVSVLVSPGETFAMAEAHCVIENTRYGLPDLPFLALMLPLALTGMVLCLPFLLQQKNRRYWLAWTAVPVLAALLMLAETRLAFR